APPPARGSEMPIAAVALFLALSAPAGGGKLAVLRLRPGPGVEPMVAGFASQLLVERLQSRGGDRILPAREVEKLLGPERQRQLAGCLDAPECIADVAKSLDADRVLAGTIGKLGGAVVMSVELVEVSSAAVLGRQAVRLKGSGEEAMLEAVAS